MLLDVGPIERSGLGAATMRSARRVVEDVVAARTGERVTIVGNPEGNSRAISSSIFHAAGDAGADARLLFQPAKGQHEPAEQEVLEAIRESDVLVSISTRHLGMDPTGARNPYPLPGTGQSADHVLSYVLATGRARACWGPGLEVEVFERSLDIDYVELRRRARALRSRMANGRRLRATAPGGTHVEMEVTGRFPFADDGDARARGASANIPCGEAGLSPVPGTARGRLVIDGSVATRTGGMILDEPVEVALDDGRAATVSGGEGAAALEESLEFAAAEPVELARRGLIARNVADVYAANARAVSEFGIGLNPKAVITGCIVEDEKVLGTCHVAFGSNYYDAPALLHLDCIVKEPTIELETGGGWITLMKDGTLCPL